jgi:hypothetical protein
MVRAPKNKGEKMKTRFLSAIVLAAFLAASGPGCVMNTKCLIDTNVKGAKVSVNGRDIGAVPASVRLSNAVWEDPEIVIEKKGYRTLHANPEKEIKVVNGVIGFLFFWPSLLWCYGPKPNQFFTLYPEE